MIELWHPQTHTFVFPSFEVTILLEELEILFNLRSSLDCEVACPLGDFHVLDILGEFKNEQDARRITAPNGIDLFKLSIWLMLHSSDPSVDSLAFAKGLSICLVGSLLFLSTVSFLHKSNVGMIRELRREKSISHSILAFLYSGLIATSIGQRPYGSVILLSL